MVSPELEADPERLCLVRETMAVIDDWGEGLPADVRFTNWGSYQDRKTGEIVLTLPEQPRTSWDDLTSDCCRYRIVVEKRRSRPTLGPKLPQIGGPDDYSHSFWNPSRITPAMAFLLASRKSA